MLIIFGDFSRWAFHGLLFFLFYVLEYFLVAIDELPLLVNDSRKVVV